MFSLSIITTTSKNNKIKINRNKKNLKFKFQIKKRKSIKEGTLLLTDNMSCRAFPVQHFQSKLLWNTIVSDRKIKKLVKKRFLRGSKGFLRVSTGF